MYQHYIILKGPKFREPRLFKWRHNFMAIRISVEKYARLWTKSEGEEFKTLSEWTKTIRKLSISLTHHLTDTYHYVFKKPE
jgi:hypothetical protein